MQLKIKYNKRIWFLLCVIDIFRKYEWVLLSKDKKCLTITLKRKPNKKWADKGGEFYNRLMKSRLKVDNIELYSTHNKGNFVAAERFIRTSRNKIYKHLVLISKNVFFIDELAVLSDKYNNTYRTMKMLYRARMLTLM